MCLTIGKKDWTLKERDKNLGKSYYNKKFQDIDSAKHDLAIHSMHVENSSDAVAWKQAAQLMSYVL